MKNPTFLVTVPGLLLHLNKMWLSLESFMEFQICSPQITR